MVCISKLDVLRPVIHTQKLGGPKSLILSSSTQGGQGNYRLPVVCCCSFDKSHRVLLSKVDMHKLDFQ